MKIKSTLLMLLIACSSLTLASCKDSLKNSSTSSNLTGQSSSTTSQTITYQLKIDTSNVKKTFTTEETFTSEGLIVNLVTLTDGIANDGEITTDYALFVNGQEIKENDSLTRGEKEIVVVYNGELKNVRSANYTISVEQAISQLSLYDVVNRILEEKNYTVESTYHMNNSQTAPIKGIILENGVYWQELTNNFETYDFTDGYGYSTYDNRTFRFMIDGDNLTNIEFIDQLGGYCNDGGLFSKTTKGYYDYITNYSINVITDEELEYLSTLEPIEGSIYNIDVEYSSWLFSMIGHKFAYYNPIYSFVSGTIQVTVNDDLTLDIYVESDYSLGAVMPMSAHVSAIGETHLTPLETFLENPDFGGAIEKDPLIDFKNIVSGLRNYTIISSDNKLTYFTENYIYGERLVKFENSDEWGKMNYIKLEANNTLGFEEGTYHLKLNNSGNFEATNEKVLAIYYLDNFRMFNDIDRYFIKTSDNNYTYTLGGEMTNDPSGTLGFFVPWFVDDTYGFNDVNNLTHVKLKISEVGYEFSMFRNDTSIGKFTITNINTTTNSAIENYYNTINRIS